MRYTPPGYKRDDVTGELIKLLPLEGQVEVSDQDIERHIYGIPQDDEDDED